MNRSNGPRWRSRLFFSLLDRLEHVARFGHARPVNLRLGRSIVVGAIGTRTARSSALKMCAHTLGFIELKRTGVCLLLGNAYVIEHVEDRLALHFQFTR